MQGNESLLKKKQRNKNMLKYSMQCVCKINTKFSCKYVFTEKILGILFRQKKSLSSKMKHSAKKQKKLYKRRIENNKTKRNNRKSK